MREITEDLYGFITSVNEVKAAGGELTKEHTRILNRYEAFANREDEAVTRLVEALAGKATDDEVALLTGLALAEQIGVAAKAQVRNAIVSHILPLIRAEYAKVATDNYDALRSTFNDTARAFIKAAGMVDPDADPALLMGRPEAERRAWADCATLSAALDAQVPALHQAALLARSELTRATDDHLPLTTDPADLHRRQVWEAWEVSDGRTRRWGALTALGVNITARPLADLSPYRRPRDFVTRYEPTGRGTSVPVVVDPEDAIETTLAHV